MCKRQNFCVHPINTRNQHWRRKHTWQDRESTDCVILFGINESGSSIKQESHLLEQERIQRRVYLYKL